MKILIAYVSKSGTTAECAELLRRQFPGSDVTLSDLAAELPDVTAYDAVIAGSYIRFGKTDRHFREFLARNRGGFDGETAWFVSLLRGDSEFGGLRRRLLAEGSCRTRV